MVEQDDVVGDPSRASLREFHRCRLRRIELHVSTSQQFRDRLKAEV